MKKIILNSFSLILLLLIWGCQFKKNHLPNVILILTDDQGWGDLSLNGNLDLSTPHIDKLARTGTRFDRFFCQSGMFSYPSGDPNRKAPR